MDKKLKATELLLLALCWEASILVIIEYNEKTISINRSKKMV
jgi:hypothetical protein